VRRDQPAAQPAARRSAADQRQGELRQVVLAHLSETNNSPAVAHEGMQRVLKRARFRGALSVAPQHGVVGPFGDVGGLGGQLSLGI